MNFTKNLLLSLLLCPMLVLQAMESQPSEAQEILYLAHVENIPELYHRLQMNPTLLNEAFFSNNHTLMEKIYSIQYHYIYGLKMNIIHEIFHFLSQNAFVKGDPFRPEKLWPIFAENLDFLLNSFNGNALCINIMHMLKKYGYTMSHLFINVSPNNLFNRDATKAPANSPESSVVIKANILLNTTFYYIKFNTFDTESLARISDTITSALDYNINMVFDLRENRGGQVRVLEELLGLFLSPDQIVAVVADKKTILERYNRTDYLYDEGSLYDGIIERPGINDNLIRPSSNAPSSRGKNYEGKIAILIGPGTCSAAETFAYALHLYTNTTLIGKQTSGESLIAVQANTGCKIEITYPVGHVIFLDGIEFEGSGVFPNLDSNILSYNHCLEIWIQN